MTQTKTAGRVAEAAAAAAQSSDPTKKVPTRRMSFEESMRELPRHFAEDGDLISCHVIAALSSVFPDGEDYFVRSVRRFRDEVTDPALKRQVAGFIGQEAVHGREHRVVNDRLGELGYPTKRYERLTRAGLRVRERILSAKSNLAATAALEHFTATLAELVLSDEDVRRQMGADAVRDLFVWHALEESEHKAVAFDVYKAVGGGERLRVFTMNVFRFGFVIGMGLAVVVSLVGDRATIGPVRCAGAGGGCGAPRSWIPPSGPSSRTTTGPTSTPTTATRPHWWKPGGASSSGSTGP